MGRSSALAALALAFGATPAAAGDCLTASVPPVSAPPRRLRFGITPQLAGTVGAGQGSLVTEDRKRALARKPAFATYRDAIAGYGVRRP